jgi:Cu-processing system permease protein
MILKIVKLEFLDSVRNGWLYFFTGTLFLLSFLLLHISAYHPSRSIVSLLNIVLFLIPLFSLLFSSLSFMDSVSFMKSVLTRPISRKQLYLGKWLGMNLSMNLSVLLGLLLPFILRTSFSFQELYLLSLLIGFSMLLNFIFSAVSFWIASLLEKKEMVLALCLGIWFYVYILYDIMMVGISIYFGDYPIEVPVLLGLSLNPVDLVRIIILLQMDVGTLMGFSAAFFQKYLGTGLGFVYAVSILLAWVFISAWMGLKSFTKKDF